jgi:hypothetical protein
MDTSYEAALLAVADAYAMEVATHGGKSLARVATIVVNRGSFFERLRDGGGCSARNLDRLADWFRDPANWPSAIAEPALRALESIGRPASGEQDLPPPFANPPLRTDDPAPEKPATLRKSKEVSPRTEGMTSEPKLPRQPNASRRPSSTLSTTSDATLAGAA